VSPLIRPHGHAIFPNSSCSFFGSPSAALPFLTGVKALVGGRSVVFVCAFGPSSPHPAPSSTYPAVPVCVFLHAVFACSVLRGLLAPRLWLAVSLHLSSCAQTRFHSRHFLPYSSPCRQIFPSISLHFVWALGFAPQEHILVAPDRRSLPLALALLPLSLQPFALAPALLPSTTPFLPTTP
jgi:hypothetical protein